MLLVTPAQFLRQFRVRVPKRGILCVLDSHTELKSFFVF
jgi:hypothetical protein